MDHGLDARLRLPDGRWLGYREAGDPRGTPLLFFHGLPGSRFQCPDHAEASDLGVRLIAPERPGYGLSDPSPEAYPLVAWPRDVAALADALEIDRFAIAGYSLGGVFAAACAHELSQRVTRVGLISSAATLDVAGNWHGWGPMRAFYELARTDAAAFSAAAESAAASPESFVAALTDAGGDVDRRALASPALRERFLRDARETLRRNAAALLRDVVLAARSWGFDVGAVRVPAFVWHGLEDVYAPPAMAKFLAATIPGARAWLYAGEGHLLMFDRWPEILRALTATESHA
jgi:pimeloyl-ACP methyl ester carboxylesterase